MTTPPACARCSWAPPMATGWRSPKDWRRANAWCSKGWTGRTRAARSTWCRPTPAMTTTATQAARPPTEPARPRGNEHLAPPHPAPGGHLAADGGAAAVGPVRVSAAAGVGTAAGGLPHHPGDDPVPGRQPDGDHKRGHRAAGTPAGPDSRTQPDVVDQLRRRLGDHPAVLAGGGPGRGGAG